MRCSQLETRLNDLLDRRVDPRSDAEIAAHTADCPRCRHWTESYVAVVRGGEDLYLAGSATRLRPIGVQGAAGAVLAVAAALLIYVTQAPTPPPADVPVESTTVGTPVPAVSALALEAGRAYVAWIHGTARSVDEAFVLASSRPPPRELLDPVVFPDDGLLKRIGNEWVPAAGETLDALGQIFTAEATL